MTKLLLILALVALLLVSAIFILSMKSRQAPQLGLQDGKLTPCGPRPNCVCSEYENGGEHGIEALDTANLTPEQAWYLIRKAIDATGGEIISQDDVYLRAHYTTDILRFTDDLEVRQDTTQRVLHLRSASRVGHSDLGANRQRVQAIQAEFMRLAALDKSPE